MREKQGYREVIADIKSTFNVGMLSIQQTAKYLNCDAKTVRRLIEGKKLPAIDLSVKKNKLYRVPVETLARFITKEN